MQRIVVMLAAAACSRHPPLASCDDDLRGVYAAGDERWMMLDHGATLEAYPLFPDAAAATGGAAVPADLVIAPRVIDLARTASEAPGAGAGSSRGLEGTLRQRFMQRAATCEAHLPVHVTRCAGDSLELVLADPAPPLGFSPCLWPGPSPSRVVRWRRD